MKFVDKIIDKLIDLGNPEFAREYPLLKTEERGFEKIAGYADIKDIMRKALVSEESINILFVGPPASAKTMFLQGVMELRRKEAVYFDATNTTNRVLDVLQIKRPKIICIDEIEKMPVNFQNKLLNFLESGHVKVDQKNTQYDFHIKGVKVFGAANNEMKISRPLLSRFGKPFYLPKYTREQFLFVAEKVLKIETARRIGEEVYARDGDMRDAIYIGKLVGKKGTEEDVEQIIRTIYKYGNRGE
jgi:Holliday junction resolvasome RuvABC ATP-dependent DNA helicase subunit